MTIRENLESISRRGALPDRADYLDLVEETITILEHENTDLRPTDDSGLSGGLVRLRKDIPTIILPDLHGRYDFFYAVLKAQFTEKKTILDALSDETVQILCLGDAFHSEARGIKRWNTAFDEYTGGFKKHRAMDEEMTESLTLMEMVMHCKCAFSDTFHFLKGNHENIQNEEGNGNHRFRKFSFEGEMVREYILKFYGEEFLVTYATLEKRFPLFAVGINFLASHSEPKRFFSETELINARLNPEVTLGLTWTNNNEAEKNSVRHMLEHYLTDPETGIYFGGHRPVSNRYLLRAGKKYIQIHNPEGRNTALIVPSRPFNPDTDILTPDEGGYNAGTS